MPERSPASPTRRLLLRRAAVLAGGAVASLLAACGAPPVPAPSAPTATPPASGATATSVATPAPAPTPTLALPTPTTVPTSTPTPVPTPTQTAAPTATAAPEEYYSAAERAEADVTFAQAQLGSPDPAWRGQKLVVGVPAGGPRGPISGPYYFWRPYFERLVGASYAIVEVPPSEIPERFGAALDVERSDFDLLLLPDRLFGESVGESLLSPLDAYFDDPRMPPVNRRLWPTPLRVALVWDGAWYGVPFDSDGYVLYYRRDVLEDPTWQEEYRKARGEPLPAFPTTWEHVFQIAKFFNGRDWNGDGALENGIALDLSTTGHSIGQFLALSAPYVVYPGPEVTRYDNVYWFDPQTMDPLIDSRGHQRALELYVELSKLGSPELASWSGPEAWNDFLGGTALMAIGPAALGALAQRPQLSRIRGKLGAVAAPASTQVFNFESGSFITPLEPSQVGNTFGDAWHAVIPRGARRPELAFFLAALQASPALHGLTILQAWGGVDPAPEYSLPPPWGTADTQAYADHGFDPGDLARQAEAYGEMWFGYPAHLPPLRIPGARRYLEALESALHSAVIGARSVPAALRDAADAWRAITEELGAERQRQRYQRDIGYVPG